MTPFTYSGTRRPTVEILPMQEPPLSARASLFVTFAFGVVCGMVGLLVAMAMWP
jgi:hypothetical protein